jgi:cytochrome P450
MATSILDLDLPLLDFFDPEVAANPFEATRRLAKEHRIARTSVGYSFLRFDDCDKIFRDRRFRTPDGMGIAAQGVTEGVVLDWANSALLALDGEVHRRVRMISQSAFTPKKGEELRQFARDLLEEIYITVVGQGAANVAELNDGYSVRVICNLLGFPDEDWKQVAAWAEAINQVISVSVLEQLPRIEKAIIELDQYVGEQIERLRGAPSDNLGSALIAAEEQGDRLSLPELVSLFEVILLAGGDTTSNMVTEGLYLFSSRPKEWGALAEDPSLSPSAVEEILRFRPPFIGPNRLAKEDVVLDDVLIPSGTNVNLTFSAGNNDPAAYTSPESFDINRFVEHGAVPGQLSFGRGMHVCLGAHLARVELQEAFRLLPRLLPNMRLDDTMPAPVEWKSPFGIHGPSQLFLRWDV